MLFRSELLAIAADIARDREEGGITRLKAIERCCKMMGYDTPEKVEHTGAGGGPLRIDVAFVATTQGNGVMITIIRSARTADMPGAPSMLLQIRYGTVKLCAVVRNNSTASSRHVSRAVHNQVYSSAGASSGSRTRRITPPVVAPHI